MRPAMDSETSEPLDEPILPDNYPVYWDYLYVADGKVVRSDLMSDVRHLKHDLGAKEIRRCDIEGRRAALSKATQPQEP